MTTLSTECIRYSPSGLDSQPIFTLSSTRASAPTVPTHHLTVMINRSVPRKRIDLDSSGTGLHSIPKGVQASSFSGGCISYSSLTALRGMLFDFRDIAGFVQHRHNACLVDHDKPYSHLSKRADQFDASCGLVLDVDLPVNNPFGISTVGEVMAALSDVHPPFAETPYLWNYSSSANIYTNSGEFVSKKIGFHIRFMTEEPWTPTDLHNLFKRLVLAGYGFVPETNDQYYVATLIDPVTQKPNQWFFEAPPELGSGLYRPPESDDFHLVTHERSRDLLPAVSPLSKSEGDRYEAKCGELRKNARIERGHCIDNGPTVTCRDHKGNHHTVPSALVDHFFQCDGPQYVEMDQQIQTADGQTIALRDVTYKRAIHSPFRSDAKPSAFAERNDNGIPYIYDSALNMTFWPKPSLLLAAADIDQELPVYERYIDATRLSHTGTTFLRSPMSTGKTTALGTYIAGTKERPTPSDNPIAKTQGCSAGRPPVIYICHREQLARQVADKTGLAFYKDAQNLASPRGLAICVDSVHKLLSQGILFDHVVIDESDQVVRHLTGETLGRKPNSGSRRYDVLDYMGRLLRGATSVVALDAHLSSLTKDYISQYNPPTPVREITNRFRPYEDCPIEIFDEGNALIADFRNSVKAHYRVALAADTNATATKTFYGLANDCPDKHGLLITSDRLETSAEVNNGDSLSGTEIDALWSDLDHTLREYDYFIYSPKIGTGYSIDDCSFDTVYGHFTYLIPSDNAQQLARIRNAGLRKVYRKHGSTTFTKGGAERSVYIVENEWRENSELLRILEQHDIRTEYDDNCQLQLEHDKYRDYLSLLATVRYHEYDQFLRGNIHLIKLLEEQGYALSYVGGTERDQNDGSKLLKDGRALSSEARKDRIINAPVIADADARTLRQKTARSVAEAAMLERYNVETFYGEPISDELLDFDSNGAMRTSIPKLKSLFRELDDLSKTDQVTARADAPTHWISEAERKVLLETIVDYIDGYTTLYDLNLAIICNELLKQRGLGQYFANNKYRLNKVFQANVPKNVTGYPSSYLQSVLKEFGFRFSSTDYRMNELSSQTQSTIHDALGPQTDDKKRRFLVVDQAHTERLYKYL